MARRSRRIVLMCRYCSGPLPTGSRSHRQFCSPRCMDRNRKGIPVPASVRQCAALGCATLLPRTATLHTRFCSRRCSQRTYSQRPGSKAYRAQWFAQNREWVQEYKVAYREERREELAAAQRARYHANPSYQAGIRDARRARERETAGPHRFTLADWHAVLRHYRHRCAYCGAAGPLEKEHIIPISRGGRDTVGNVVPACFPCNRGKGRLLLTEWTFRGRPRPDRPTAVAGPHPGWLPNSDHPGSCPPSA